MLILIPDGGISDGLRCRKSTGCLHFLCKTFFIFHRMMVLRFLSVIPAFWATLKNLKMGRLAKKQKYEQR
ncbi:hypothetical protein CGZ65_08350 [Neisseria weixii]|nr:hypothetical protein CGZ65_08350 [Neisseria weixii]